MILLAFLPGNAQIVDSFGDGNFTSDLIWAGETEKFRITNEELELNDAAGTGGAYLIAASTIAENATWEFYHRYRNNPSSSNFAEVYLLANQPDLSDAVNGYFVRVGGESGTSDKVVLYRRDGNQSSEIITTADGSALNSNSRVDIDIRVTRDNSGNWQLWSKNTSDTTYTLLGSAIDNTYTTSKYFGVKVKYSSSYKSGYYFFDDFKITGTAIPDNQPPQLNALQVLSDTTILIGFDEAVAPQTAEDPTNYMVNNGINLPSQAQLVGANKVQLTFATPFQNAVQNELTISGVSDLHGNTIANNTRNFTYYTTVPSAFNEILITEIHAEPGQNTLVPNVEFVELFNPTNKAFQLLDYQLFDGSNNSPAELPIYILAPNSYVVVCGTENVGLFSTDIEVIGVSELPELNNTEDDLYLLNDVGDLIFHITYDDDWYRSAIKADGGWSLEMIDTDFPCLEGINWVGSNDANGGTPGLENSQTGLVEDLTGIEISDVLVVDSANLIIEFSEKIDLLNSSSVDISIDNGIGQVINYSVIEPTTNSIAIETPNPLSPNVIYTLTINQIFDCSGNEIAQNSTVTFGLPVEMEFGDIIINEVLFNPATGQVDFVELYNLSDKILSASDLLIAEADYFMPDSVIDNTSLFGSQKIIFPKDFLVLSSDVNLVKAHYFTPSPNKFLDVSGFPNYPDDEGTVILYKNDLTLLDQLTYIEDWHNPLIDDENGVSLERIDYYQPTQLQSNWTSAAATVGFATPGYTNSTITEIDISDEVVIEPEIFSPNGDGLDDFTLIKFSLDKIGYIGNIKIFDVKGRLINHLVRNETFSQEGFYRWDGITDEGYKARTGIYIVLIDLFDLDGNSKKIKQKIVISNE